MAKGYIYNYTLLCTSKYKLFYIFLKAVTIVTEVIITPLRANMIFAKLSNTANIILYTNKKTFNFIDLSVYHTCTVHTWQRIL